MTCPSDAVFNHFVLLFQDLNQFPTDERDMVNVKEGQGVVLLCDPPSRYPSKGISLQLSNNNPVFTENAFHQALNVQCLFNLL